MLNGVRNAISKFVYPEGKVQQKVLADALERSVYHGPIDFLKGPSVWMKQIQMMGGGVHVNEQTVFGISAYFHGLNSVATDVAQNPFRVYESTSDGGRIIASNHDQYPLFKLGPNQYTTKTEYVRDLILFKKAWGNGYAFIERGDNGRPISYNIRLPREIETFKDDFGKIWHRDLVNGEDIDDFDMIHIKEFSLDGIKGLSRMTYMQNTLKQSIASQNFLTDFYEKGMHSNTALKIPSVVKDNADKEKILKAWHDANHGPSSNHKTALLMGGAELERIGIAPKDAEMSETLSMNIEELSRLSNCPPHRMFHLKDMTLNNIDQMNINYVQFSLQPEATQLEEEHNKKSFRVSERGRVFCKIELKGLLRGDLKSRALWHRTMTQNGLQRINEGRAVEDLPAIDGGDETMWPLNMIPGSQKEAFFDAMINDKSGQTMTKYFEYLTEKGKHESDEGEGQKSGE